MSSFYGQMRWQDFQRFFYNFTISNNVFSAENTFNEYPTPGNATVEPGWTSYLQPNEDFATLRINAANHWIKLNPTDSVGDEPVTYSGFSIFHNKASTEDTESVKVFDITTIPADEEATILRNGDGFRILELKFDKAGHYSDSVSLEPTYFQLPPQIIRVNFTKDLYVNDDQKFHFNEDDWVKLKISEDGKVLNFEHKSNFAADQNTTGFEKQEEGEFQVKAALREGDYFATDNVVYDKAGHLISVERVYYQLPISEVVGDLADLSKTVEDLITNVDGLSETVASNSEMVGDHDERLAKAEAMLGSHDEMQTALTGFRPASDGQKFTVAQGFTILSEEIKSGIDEEIKGIYARLTALEEKIK